MLAHSDIFTLISPILRLFRYLGIAPYVIKGSCLEISRTNDIITSIVHFVGLYLYLITQRQVLAATFQLTYFFELSFSLFPTALCFFIIVLGKIYKHRVAYVWNDLHDIHKDLGILGANYGNYFGLKTWIVITVILDFLSNVAVMIWIIVINWSYSFSGTTEVVINFYYSNVTHFILTNYVYMFAKVVENLFENLNYVIVVKLFAVGSKNAELSNPLEIVSKLTAIHRRLSQTIKKNNQLVSIPILLIFGLYFRSLVVHTINITVAELSKQPVTSLYIISNSMVVTYAVLKILQMVHSSEQYKRTANYTKKILFDVILHVQNYSLKKELNSFSLQAFQEELGTTAGGFFALGYPIILSIISALSTYVVIFVQTNPDAYFTQHFVKREN